MDVVFLTMKIQMVTTLKTLLIRVLVTCYPISNYLWSFELNKVCKCDTLTATVLAIWKVCRF